MQIFNFLGGTFYFFTKKKLIFRPFFLLFTASVRSRPPGPPAVPGVFFFGFGFKGIDKEGGG